MSKIRGSNTKPELTVFKELRKRKIHFQKHYRKVSGSPDIAMPKKKIAIFIDGDFWHGYKFSERVGLLPKVYWREKIANNMKRDKRNRGKLRRDGWKVLRIWEHEVKKSKDRVVEKILALL